MAQNDTAKRAITVLTIAQLKFKQALKKQDIDAALPPITVEDSSQFFTHVDAVLKQNTPEHIQNCTEWIVKNIALSKPRVVVLGDYLVSVSKSIIVDHQTEAVAATTTTTTTAPLPGSSKTTETTAASAKAVRNRFDLVLIVSDALHAVKFHHRTNAVHGVFSKELAPFILELVELAASCIFVKDSQPEKKLRACINYWAVSRFLSTEDLKSCQAKADEALLLAQGGTPVRKRTYLLPEYHGDKDAPWHVLPASYMLEQMIKYPTRPIDPSRIRVAKFNKKPVSPHVRALLDDFFENIDLKHKPTGDNPKGETNKYKLSLDPLGQLVKQNKETGETSTVCSGYGWSPKFCQDMREHGVPENIKIAREDFQRTGETEDVPDRRQRPSSESEHRREQSSDSDSSSGSSYDNDRDRRYSDRRRSPADNRRRSGDRYDPRHGGSGPRRGPHDRDSSRSGPQRNERNFANRNSRGSLGNNHNHNHRSPVGTRGRSGDRYDPRRGRSGPRRGPRDRDSSRSGPQRNGRNFANRNSRGSLGNQQHINMDPHQQPQGFGRSLPQQVQQYAPLPPPPLGQFPPPPVPLPYFQAPGAFPANIAPPPPPPPPSFGGQYPPPPANVAAVPYNPYAFTEGYGNRQDNQQSNSFGYGNNGGYSQNRGGYAGNAPGGRYYNNRGGSAGPQHRQRGGRY